MQRPGSGQRWRAEAPWRTPKFRERHDRDRFDDAELKAYVAEVAKPPRQPVAGVDLAFTPVKSVSVLWALGDEGARQ
jgi:conjugative relaxase-like TrwC/TraI family protein